MSFYLVYGIWYIPKSFTSRIMLPDVNLGSQFTEFKHCGISEDESEMNQKEVQLATLKKERRSI